MTFLQALNQIVGMLGLLGLPLILVNRADLFDVWVNTFVPLYLAYCFLSDIRAVLHHDPVRICLWSSLVLIIGWAWWNMPSNRDRRKKWKKKFSEAVKDMGGRLKVIRPTEG